MISKESDNSGQVKVNISCGIRAQNNTLTTVREKSNAVWLTDSTVTCVNVVCCWQAIVLDSLKTTQEKYGDTDGLQHTRCLIEKLYQQHDELDPDHLGDLSDTSDDDDNDDDDDDDDINLDEISDDSGHMKLLLLFKCYD